MQLTENIKEVRVTFRRGVQKVDVAYHGEAAWATWRDGDWTPETGEVPEAVKADVRRVGAWLTGTVGKAVAD